MQMDEGVAAITLQLQGSAFTAEEPKPQVANRGELHPLFLQGSLTTEARSSSAALLPAAGDQWVADERVSQVTHPSPEKRVRTQGQQLQVAHIAHDDS